MPTPTPSDQHVDMLLTGFSVGYVQDQSKFIADKVFPRRGVNNQSNKYATYVKGDTLRSNMERRGRGAASPSMIYRTSNDSYSCEDWSLAIPVDDRQVANADDPFNPRRDATRVLTQQELIRREQSWGESFFTTGVWGVDKTGGSDFVKFSDSLSDPVGAISDYQEDVEDATGLEPMDLVMSKAGWNALKNHPDILYRIVGGSTSASPAIASRERVAEILGVERIHVGGGVVNTAGFGETVNMSRILGKHMLLCYVDPNPSEFAPTAGMTFVWSGYIGSEEGRRIKTWRDEAKESEMIEIQANWDQKVVAADCGIFLANAVA